ncbi:hypothetical protein GCK32_000165 [Trichostrongylus colubriformis]|uniref:Neurotransmitter-gated ion-channel ligand-binding domain-containing protein n=1 Tax=Trichostrongylus colubriformis TaxID=6319 RepID=A0AAN8FND3_TRICO
MMLILICFVITDATIPKSLLVSNRSYPPTKPVNVGIRIDVQQTQMDFKSATLYVHGTTTLSWTDMRKSWLPSEEGLKTYSIDAGVMPNDFRQVYACLWVPSIKNHFKLLTFRSASNLFSDQLVFTSEGEVSHDFRFMLMVSCIISDINYPYDTYECYEKFRDYEKNTTVRYTYGTDSKEFMTVSANTYRSGHKITEYTSYKNVTSIGKYYSVMEDFFLESIEIGFTVQRNQPRVVINFILPLYCITFADAFMHVFGHGMQRAFLLPVYVTFFTDISSIYTVSRLPHIVRWFFARLFSSSVCFIALMFTKELTRSCSRRFVAIATTTTIFYAIFSIPYDIFRS